jgi:hypothetical protein
LGATGDLLTKLQLEFMFVGSVARVAWIGGTIASGSIDVIAILQPQQKSQIAMMASNNGFLVDRDEVEAAEELDLVPMRFEGVRVHVLVASNALYGRMVRDAWSERIGDHDRLVPSREDLALLLAMSEHDEDLQRIIGLPEFDRERYNDKVISIGLRACVIPSAARDLLRTGEGDSSPSNAARNDTE